MELNFCPDCGAKVAANDNFCSECGKNFTEEIIHKVDAQKKTIDGSFIKDKWKNKNTRISAIIIGVIVVILYFNRPFADVSGEWWAEPDVYGPDVNVLISGRGDMDITLSGAGMYDYTDTKNKVVYKTKLIETDQEEVYHANHFTLDAMELDIREFYDDIGTYMEMIGYYNIPYKEKRDRVVLDVRQTEISDIEDLFYAVHVIDKNTLAIEAYNGKLTYLYKK